MEHIVNLITGIAWPAAIVWVALLFRREVRALLKRISQIKYGDVEATFGEGLAEAEAKAEKISVRLEAIPTQPALTPRLEQLRRIADVSPRAAILEAWVLVEEAAAKSGFVQGATVQRVNIYLFIDELIKQNKLPFESAVLFERLRKLRNQAAHLPDFSITKDEADRYLQLAAKASELILSVDDE